MFFGCSCVALGYLTFTSGLLPKALGVLMAIAGACYLTTQRCTAPLSPAGFDAVPVNPRAGIHR